MKRLIAGIVVLGLAPFSFARTAGGFRGVPWSGTKEQFRDAIPGLTCAPVACNGSIDVGDIPVRLSLYWGRGGPNLSSLTMEFSQSNVSDMKKILREKYGTPTRSYFEDGSTHTDWKLSDVTIELDPGQTGEDAVVSFTVNAAYKKFATDDTAEKKRKAEEHKKAMSKAAKSF